jgi:putative phosphoserine phosphatase/1-acylglycerol-3-phosphate O-acyltransferase
LLRAPLWLAAEARSRRLLNELFYREYAGLERRWLAENAARMCDAVVKPALFPKAASLVAADRGGGYRTVLLSGSIDIAIAPLVRELGLDEAVTNRLIFVNGAATGELDPPILAGGEKASAIRRLCAQYNVDSKHCKAYSDSWSDAPMLEAVGLPAAVHPDRRLRRMAEARGWPILNLRA